MRFISAEPSLGPVDLESWLEDGDPIGDGSLQRSIDAGAVLETGRLLRHGSSRLDWVIVGGESDPGARPCALEWLESIVSQCRTASVPVFVKQLGSYAVSEERTAALDCFSNPDQAPSVAPNGERWAWRQGTADRKGGDPSEWPEDFRVREFPEVRA